MKISLCLLGAIFFGPLLCAQTTPESVKVLSFNIWGRGGTSLANTIETIRQSGADVVALQESSSSNAQYIAQQLGWNYYSVNGDDEMIVSKHALTTTPGQWGAKVTTAAGNSFYLFNVHLRYYPYGPYQLNGISYQGYGPIDTSDPIAAAQEAIATNWAMRGPQVTSLLADIANIQAQGLPLFIAGDFNEPSYLDWSDAAVIAGLIPIAVEWPTTKALADAGFLDAYREIHPDPVEKPGDTWSPRYPSDPQDRIDMILYQENGTDLLIDNAQTLGENTLLADLAVSGFSFPSDHRAVLVTFSFIPEPSVYALLGGVAVAGLALIRRRG